MTDRPVILHNSGGGKGKVACFVAVVVYFLRDLISFNEVISKTRVTRLRSAPQIFTTQWRSYVNVAEERFQAVVSKNWLDLLAGIVSSALNKNIKT